MNRALRRDITMRKYISRIKKRLYQIVVPFGNSFREPETWKDADESCRWVKQLKHNHNYGRSTMNVLEKHFRVKNIRKETKKLIRNYEDF